MNSIQGLDNSEQLFIEPNWINPINPDFNFNREISQYIGTTIELYDLLSPAHELLSFTYSNLSKSDELYLINFFINHRGKHKKFWLPMWKKAYKLYNNINNGDTNIIIENAKYSLVDSINERIFIKLYNGDIITRQVITVLQTGTEETIFLNTAMDRNLQNNNIKYFCRLIMARFDIDELNFNFFNHNLSETTLRFTELPYEYPVEGS